MVLESREAMEDTKPESITDRISSIRAELAKANPFAAHRADLEWALDQLEWALDTRVQPSLDQREAVVALGYDPSETDA